jgi:hypothetical protein
VRAINQAHIEAALEITGKYNLSDSLSSNGILLGLLIVTHGKYKPVSAVIILKLFGITLAEPNLVG